MRDCFSEERVSWIRLSRTPSIGSVSFQKLIKRYKSANNALKHIPELARRGGLIKPLKIPSAHSIIDELKQTEKFGAEIILSYEQNFPKLLKQLNPPPPLITVKGNQSLFEAPFLAIIGSRNASAFGCRMAYTFAQELSRLGYVIVSGMAKGIDSSAHKGALEQGTLAVLAGGINHIYPIQNKELYHRISKQGILVSESIFGYEPKARDFPRRNRLISGLCLGVIVIEATLHSGSLITANMALEQNREVMAVPGSPMDRRAKGTNKLIRSGNAALVESYEDVHHIIQNTHNIYFESAMEDEYELETETYLDDHVMEKIRTRLKTLISASPVHIDELIEQTDENAHHVSVALLELELAGFINWTPGNMISSTPSNL